MEVCYLTLLLFFLKFLSTASVIQQCTEYTATPFQQTKLIYQGYYYSCGWLGWSSCYKTYSYTSTFTVYMATVECCKGYSGVNCTAFCSFDCLYNSECSAPQTCTCIDGWEGTNCLTDIDECADSTDLCELHDTCVNTNGSYSCGCYQDQVLANDGYRCLESVTDLILKPGKRTIKLEFLIPQSFYDDGEFEGFYVNCSSEFHSTDDVYLGNKTVLNIVDLLPFTKYNCCIQPRWVENGYGPETCAEVETLQDAPDTPPQNVSIKTISERSALIQWGPPEISNGILDYYRLHINYTNSTPIHHIDVLPIYSFFLHEYLNPHQTVGVSISASTVGGEGPMSLYMFATTLQDEPGAVDDLTVDVLASYAVNITWLPPEALNGILLKYYLNITKETATESIELFFSTELEPQEEFYVTLNHLEPYIPYTVSVAATTIIGLGEVFPLTFFTSQETPSVPPKFDVIVNSPVSITVSWVPLSLFELRGFLLHYQVVLAESVIHSGCVSNSTINDKATNTTRSSVILSVNPFKEYCIFVSAATHVGFGKKSDFFYLQEYENSLFEIHFLGIGSCRRWLEVNVQYKIDAVLEEVLRVLKDYCFCNVQSNHFSDPQFVCNELDENRVIFQARVAGTVETDSKTLLDYLQLWLRTSPIVAIQGDSLTVDKNCEVVVDDIIADCVAVTEPSTDAQMSDNTFELTAEGITSIVLGLAVIGCSAVIIVLTAVLCHKRFKPGKKKTRPISQMMNSGRPLILKDTDDDDNLLLLVNEEGHSTTASTDFDNLTSNDNKHLAPGEVLY